MFASEWLIFGHSDAIVHYEGGVLDVGSLVAKDFADAVDDSASHGVWPTIHPRSPVWMPSGRLPGIRQMSSGSDIGRQVAFYQG
jgi:hypothetical protein